MSKGHLRACPACSRHIRVTEVRCPFCRHALGESFREAGRPRPLTRRLTRAARYALGTGTLSLAAACGSASGLFPTLDAGEAGEAGEEDAAGGRDSGGLPGGDAATGSDAQSFAPPYGAFPVPDSGEPSDDAGFVEDVVVAPPYGLPP